MKRNYNTMALDVACPHCAAPVGEKCMGRWRRINNTHTDRRAQASLARRRARRAAKTAEWKTP